MAIPNDPLDAEVLRALRARHNLMDDERYGAFEKSVNKHFKESVEQLVIREARNILENLYSTQEEQAADLLIERSGMPRFGMKHVVWILTKYRDRTDVPALLTRAWKRGYLLALCFARERLGFESRPIGDSQFDRLHQVFCHSLNGQKIDPDLRDWVDPYLFCLWIIDEGVKS